MRVVFVVNSLTAGGAERTATLIANGLAKRGYDVSVITVVGRKVDFYALAPGLKRVSLDQGRRAPTVLHSVLNVVRRVKRLRQAIRSEEPDRIISFADRVNILTLLATIGLDMPVIVSERAYPTIVGVSVRLLRRLLYPRADLVVSVSRGVDEFFRWLPEGKHSVIHNSAVDVEQSVQLGGSSQLNADRKHIVSMGRLVRDKNYGLLIRAFGKIASQYDQWDLVILGEGVQRAELENLVIDLGLTQRVFLPGNVANPFPLLNSADLFVLSSVTEGMPNALLEAMACGLPVISTDYTGGASDIIRENIDGLIVPSGNVSSLAAAMSQLISDEAQRRRMAARAVEVKQRFSLDRILDEWEAALHKARANHEG